jgi:hypothetical protein
MYGNCFWWFLYVLFFLETFYFSFEEKSLFWLLKLNYEGENVMDQINEYVENFREKSPSEGYLGFVPRIVCADGFSMSVQASSFHYCSPRCNAGPWESFEIGFPSANERILAAYKQGYRNTKQTETVFPYVPVSVILKIIKKHGGIDLVKTFAAHMKGIR